MKISTNKLSFKYKKQQNTEVISNVNLELKENSINVILGLNGSGKTTLLKLLAGLLKPNSGDIFYGDYNLKNIKIGERSKIFSYVPQHAVLSSDIKILDYLSFGLVNNLSFYQSPSKKMLEKVDKIAEDLKITNLFNKNLGEISGGEKQEILIAAALVQDTPVIILDEPTSALDLKNQNMVLNLLKEITKTGKTILLSVHNPNHALFLDANVILIKQGEVLKSGCAKNIVKIEILKEIYGTSLCKSS